MATDANALLPPVAPGKARRWLFRAAAVIPCVLLLAFCGIAVHEWWLIATGQIAVIPTPRPGDSFAQEVSAASVVPFILGSGALAATFAWAALRGSSKALIAGYVIAGLIAGLAYAARAVASPEGAAVAKKLATLIAAALLAGCATPAPKSPTPRVCFHANEAIEKDVGYCQALRVGNTVYISGITARGPMPEAVKSVYERLKKSLEAHGLTYADVVKENVYAVDLDAFIAAQAIRRPYYGDTIPAATWVQVQQLYLPAFVLEVELVAEIPQ